MDFNQLGTVIFAIGTTMWIPIWALFEGVAKCIRALKGTDVTMFRNNKNHEWSDSDDENLEENKPKEENNATEQKTKRTRTTTKTAKDSSQK